MAEDLIADVRRSPPPGDRLFSACAYAATWVQRTWDIHGGRWSQAEKPKVTWLPSMNLLVRRNAFLSIGGFNEGLETADDVDLCYRLAWYGTILSVLAMRLFIGEKLLTSYIRAKRHLVCLRGN